MRRLLASLVVTTGMFIAAPAAADAAPLGGLQIGSVGTDAATIDSQLDTASKLHAKVVRATLNWDQAEPQQGAFDPGIFAALDRIESDARARGLQTVITVVGTPCWASSAPDKACNGTTTPGSVSQWQPTDAASVGGIFAEVAKHLGAENAGLEVWNEPDQANELYFKGPDKSTKYVALLQTAYKAIKAANPNVKVLGGALVGYNGVFLQNMYDKGAKGFYDALDLHYYDVALAKLRAIRQVMTKNGDTAPVWLGEFGFDSCAPAKKQGPHVCLTRKNQARALTDVFAAIRRTPWLLGAIVYTLSDVPGANGFKFGMLDTAGHPKPAYSALRNAFQSKGRAQSIRLRLRRQRGRARISLHGPYGELYSLTARGHGRLFRAQISLDSGGNFSYLLPAALGTRGVKVHVTYPWNGRGASKTLR